MRITGVLLAAGCVLSAISAQRPETALPTAEVSVYQTRLDTLSPGALLRLGDDFWMTEAQWTSPSEHTSNIVRICPGVPPDSVIQVTPTSFTVIPTGDTLRLGSVDTVVPRSITVYPVTRPTVPESTGAFVRFRIPSTGWCLDFCHSSGFFFTERKGNRISMMDVEAMVVKEWALPSPDAFPVGLTSRDDTVFFAEVDASILGRLIVSENKVTEWELPGAGTPGWPGVCLDDSQNVWVACRTSHELIRVRILAGDTAVLSRFVVPRISSDGPTDLLFVAGPGIWFSMSEFHGGRTKIGYLDLGTMYCRQWRLPADTMNAYRIAADLCGNVWFYDNLTSLASLAPSTNTMTWYPALYPKTYPQGTYGLAVGDSGDVWMTSVYGQVFRYRNVVTGLAANNAPAVPKAGVGATPNPFRRYVRFIGTPLGVYDRSGRLVMPLPGSTWDGRTADGREVRPGVYFIRFASGQQVKLVKTR